MITIKTVMVKGSSDDDDDGGHHDAHYDVVTIIDPKRLCIRVTTVLIISWSLS